MNKVPITITKISPFSGKSNTIVIMVYHEDWMKYLRGEAIQYCFPYLSANEREFVMTGIPNEEWEKHVKEENET